MKTFAEIRQSLARELEQMDAIIDDTLHSTSQLTNEITTHYMAAKGKQLRPVITLLSGKFFGGVTQKVLHAAGSIELLHNASLIHDDVIDLAKNRRGINTINSVWDNHVAVLVGDFFVSGALQLAVKTGDPHVLNALATMGKDLAMSEINQVDFAQRHQYDEQAYMDVIRGKTASLFECCVLAGGYACDAPEQPLEALRRFAELLGICFQIKDDTFDYFHDPEVGKPTGNDLREGKVTLPLIYALRNAPDNIKQLLEKEQLGDDDIHTLVEFAKDAGGIDYAYTTMNQLREKAAALLAPYADNPVCSDFNDIFLFVIDRKK